MEKGLTTQAAEEKLTEYGLNQIEETKGPQALEMFLSQFKSFVILILFLAALFSLLIKDYLDTGFILAIIIINGIFGFIQEYRAEKLISALKKFLIEQSRVIRDGKEILIESKYLVPGDLVIVSEGDKIPADGKLIEAFSLEVNESTLTGESFGIYKSVSDGEEGQVFASTSVEKGKGKVIISATGMNSRFGKIASLLKEIKEEETPLEKQLQVLGKNLGFIAIAAILLVFSLLIFRQGNLIESVLTSVSLAVAIIPEGLPAVLTITLALGVQRMVKANSIVRKLAAIESLGATDVILTDKTGTITKNEMHVRKLYFNGKILDKKDVKSYREVEQLLKIGSLCNTANLVTKIDGKKYEILGDRTEGAILIFAKELGLDLESVRNKEIVLEEFPFDPSLKTMTIVLKKDKNLEILTKGAPEVVLAKSKNIFIDGRVVSLDPSQKRKLEEAFNSFAKSGLRVLALASKEIKIEDKLTRESVERELDLVGLLGISDPPREEVAESLKIARTAGIEVVMVTGDSPATAQAIGSEIGLFKEGDLIMEGEQLSSLDDESLGKIIEKVRIFARTTPEQKLRIVKTYQAKGKTVAVTGDGVNDAPALRSAEVGVAMGVVGTEVAKEASDMVITDDNFSSIVKAVEEGRIIYDNIVKSLRYLLSDNASEFFTIFGAALLGLPTPLAATQILWINLVSDGLPALAISADPKDPDVMKRMPRNKSVPLLNFVSIPYLATIGIFFSSVIIILFSLALLRLPEPQAKTLAFNLMVLVHMFAAFLARKTKKWWNNRFLIGAILLTLSLQLLINLVPALQEVFRITSLF